MGASDGQLLDRFSREGDEGAFAILVERHGPMVFRVCRAILDDDDDARDAFQATFLVLVRRLRRIDRTRSVGPWLFGVARKTSVRARADAAKRRAREREAAEARAQADDQPAESWAELYEELDRLPERYRAPLVLCHLQGYSVEQAAARLGCPQGTVFSRLSRGRDQLKERLTRRGLAPLAVPLSAGLTSNTTTGAAVPPALADATTRAASQGLDAAATATLGSIAVKTALSALAIGGLVAGSLLVRPPAPSARPAARPVVQVPAPGKVDDRVGVAFVPLKIESQSLQGHDATVLTASFSPDGKRLATGDVRGKVKLWDVATGRQEASLAIQPRPEWERDAIMALDFSPDGKTLAMAVDDQTIRLIDVASRKETLRLIHGYFANTVAYSPDGKTLAWAVLSPGEPIEGTPDKRRCDVVLWDLAAGRERASLAGHTDGIERVSFSHDGEMIASAGRDHAVRLWDAATGEPRGVLDTGSTYVFGLAFSPDGKALAAAGSDQSPDRNRPEKRRFSASPRGVVRVWDVDARAARSSFASHGDYALRVAFSPDGRYLATSGQNNLIRIRDAATGEERAVLQGRESFLYGLGFSPDGKTLVAAGDAGPYGGGVQLWRVGDLLGIAPTRPNPSN